MSCSGGVAGRLGRTRSREWTGEDDAVSGRVETRGLGRGGNRAESCEKAVRAGLDVGLDVGSREGACNSGSRCPGVAWNVGSFAIIACR